MRGFRSDLGSGLAVGLLRSRNQHYESCLVFGQLMWPRPNFPVLRWFPCIHGKTERACAQARK